MKYIFCILYYSCIFISMDMMFMDHLMSSAWDPDQKSQETVPVHLIQELLAQVISLLQISELQIL